MKDWFKHFILYYLLSQIVLAEYIPDTVSTFLKRCPNFKQDQDGLNCHTYFSESTDKAITATKEEYEITINDLTADITSQKKELTDLTADFSSLTKQHAIVVADKNLKIYTLTAAIKKNIPAIRLACNMTKKKRNEIMLVKSYVKDEYDDLQKFFTNLPAPKKSLLKNQLLNVAIRYSWKGIECKDKYVVNSKRLIQIQKTVKNQVALSDLSIKYGYRCVYDIKITRKRECGDDQLQDQLMYSLLHLKESIKVTNYKCHKLSIYYSINQDNTTLPEKRAEYENLLKEQANDVLQKIGISHVVINSNEISIKPITDQHKSDYAIVIDDQPEENDGSLVGEHSSIHNIDQAVADQMRAEINSMPSRNSLADILCVKSSDSNEKNKEEKEENQDNRYNDL